LSYDFVIVRKTENPQKKKFRTACPDGEVYKRDFLDTRKNFQTPNVDFRQ
jgi:hypothetical protein